MVSKKSKGNLRLLAIFFSVFCILIILAMAAAQETELQEVSINIGTSIVDNQVIVKGEALLPDETVIRLMAIREITFERNMQDTTTGDVFLASADTEVNDGKFEATFSLDDHQWYDELLENPECELVAAADYVKVKATYIPEKPKSLFTRLPIPAGFSLAVKLPFSIKLPFLTKAKKVQYLPVISETLVEYPFNNI